MSNPADFCRGFTSELEYFEGPLYDPNHPMGADLSFYSRVKVQGTNLITFKGVMEEFEQLGTHYYRIKSTLGSPDSSANARGNGGQYNSIYSDPTPVTIVNPCRNSTVNMDGRFFMENLKVPINSGQLWEFYSDPTDSISSIYGNGWNRCGHRSYTFLDEHRKEAF